MSETWTTDRPTTEDPMTMFMKTRHGLEEEEQEEKEKRRKREREREGVRVCDTYIHMIE